MEKTDRERGERGIYPRATVASQSGGLGIGAVKQLHVVVAAVGLLLDLEGLEDELHAVALLRRDHPLTVRRSGVVVVTELGVGEQVFGLDLGLQTTSALCRSKITLRTPRSSTSTSPAMSNILGGLVSS